MATEGPRQMSWWRRNRWPLLAGGVGVVALLGWALVAVDQLADDDGDVGEQVEARSDRDADRFRFLGGVFGSSGVLLGVAFAEFDELVVADVMPGSPADEAGLRRGDEIREVDGERVRDLDELRGAIEDVEPGNRYELTIERDDEELELTVRRPEAFAFDGPHGRQRARPFDIPRFEGRSPGDAQPGVPDQFESLRLRPTLGVSVVQTNEGLEVLAVFPDSAAAEAGFREGDLITKVGRERVRTIDELRQPLPVFDVGGDEHPDEIGDAVEFTVMRDGRELELEVIFSIRPGELIPVEPPRSVNPVIPEEALEALLERLGQLEERLQSDEFVEELVDRLLEELDPLVLTPPGVPGGDEQPASDFDLSAALAGLDVFSGSVSAVSDASITLSGSRGAISYTLTDETVFVGALPRVGGIAAVAVDADGLAVLVVVAN